MTSFESADLLRLEKVFKELGSKQQRSIIISALRKATKPTQERAKSNIHNVTGNLRRSIGLLVMRNEAAVVIGARKRGGYKGFHGHLVEDGTAERSYVAKRGWVARNQKTGNLFRVSAGDTIRTGRIKASASYSDWFQRAVDVTQKSVMDTMGDEWYKAIDKFHKKYGLR